MLLLPPPPPPVDPNDLDPDLEPGDLPPELESPMTKKQYLKKRLCVFFDFGFDIYFFTNILWNCGSAVFIAFGPDFFKDEGLDKVWIAHFVHFVTKIDTKNSGVTSIDY